MDQLIHYQNLIKQALNDHARSHSHSNDLEIHVHSDAASH
jgi:hypothetical protein